MATQKQIDANRINAKKSTGPKTPEGKAASKFNRLTHGLRAEQHVIPGEDPAEFRAFLDAWVADWNPTTMARLELVQEAATAAWRRRRCRRAEAARLAGRVRKARGFHHQKEKVLLDAVTDHLLRDPAALLPALMLNREGVDRQLALWSEIARAAGSIDTWDDLRAHHDTLFALQGRRPDDPANFPWHQASRALYLRNRPEERREGDPELDDDAHGAAIAANLGCIASAYLAALAEHRASLPDGLAEAGAESSAAGHGDEPMLRYEAQLSRQFDRSLAALVKLTTSGDDLVETESQAPGGPDPSAESDAPNEPDSVPESDVEEGVASDFGIVDPAPEEPRDVAETPVAAAEARPRRRRVPSRPKKAPKSRVRSGAKGGEAPARPARGVGRASSSPPEA